MMDVTSIHRPDTDWSLVDSHGHGHRWHADGVAVTSYDPRKHYDVPSLLWVKDGVAYYEDGEPYDVGHHECRQCGEHVEPRYTADTEQQMVAGLRWYRINGQPVSPEEFHKRRG
jgi:hypothetical protein